MTGVTKCYKSTTRQLSKRYIYMFLSFVVLKMQTDCKMEILYSPLKVSCLSDELKELNKKLVLEL
jgi:hypothetical protein